MNDISENDWQNTRLLSVKNKCINLLRKYHILCFVLILKSIFSLWQCQMFDGKWETGISAGGRGEGRNSSTRRNINTF